MVDKTIDTTLFVVISNDAFVDDEFVVDKLVDPVVMFEFEVTEDSAGGNVILGVYDDILGMSVVN